MSPGGRSEDGGAAEIAGTVAVVSLGGFGPQASAKAATASAAMRRTNPAPALCVVARAFKGAGWTIVFVILLPFTYLSLKKNYKIIRSEYKKLFFLGE